jgi:hypothetical protein
MAENTNAQAVAFVDEKLRIAGDVFISAVRTMRQLIQDYADDGIAPLVGATPELFASPVAANSANDPRTIITGLDSNPAYLVALSKPAVNIQPRF